MISLKFKTPCQIRQPHPCQQPCSFRCNFPEDDLSDVLGQVRASSENVPTVRAGGRDAGDFTELGKETEDISTINGDFEISLKELWNLGEKARFLRN